MQPSPTPAPSLTLPDPLRAAEISSFTNYSVVVRLPEIAQRTMAENHFHSDINHRVERLVSEIHAGQVRKLHGIPAEYGWDEYVKPYLGSSWLTIPWFFAEEYFYLRMLEACRYFEPGPGYLRDPYAQQKRLGLETTRDLIHQMAKQTRFALDWVENWRESLTRLLLADLWGNQNDLSMWPVEQNGDGNTLSGGSAAPDGANPKAIDNLVTAREHVLSDDTSVFLDAVDRLDMEKARVDFILDNAGYELATDLALADFLLGSRRASQIVLHAKRYPVFVSDALEQDIHDTLDWLAFSANDAEHEMAIRLRLRLVNGTLRLSKHAFWTSPLAAWEMPVDLMKEINQSDLLIWKGDANYRRLLGDRHWPLDTPFSSIVSYFKPAVLALRTCKSEIGVGIHPDRIPAEDETWQFNGKWGLIQFSPGRKCGN